MRTIGIKLADGSFYPILEEGVAGSKTLDITTANDNQTTVLVDLYRSSDGTMDSAEYVDTLRVEVAPHRIGENTLSFNVSLDESGHLSAQIHDPQSGGTSNTDVTLLPRTEDERRETSDDADAVSLGSEMVTDGADAINDGEAAAVMAAASGAAVESAQALDKAISAEATEAEEIVLDDDNIEAVDADIDVNDSDVNDIIEENPTVIDDTSPSETEDMAKLPSMGENTETDGGTQTDETGTIDDLGEADEPTVAMSDYATSTADEGSNIDFNDIMAATESDDGEVITDANDFGNIDISSSYEEDAGDSADKTEEMTDKEAVMEEMPVTDSAHTDATEDNAMSNLDDLDLPDIDVASDMASTVDDKEEMPDLELPDFSETDAKDGIVAETDEGTAALGGMDESVAVTDGLELDDMDRADLDDTIPAAIPDNENASGEDEESTENASAEIEDLPSFDDLDLPDFGDDGTVIGDEASAEDKSMDFDLPDFSDAVSDEGDSSLDDVAGMSLDELLGDGASEDGIKAESGINDVSESIDQDKDDDRRGMLLPVAICVSCAVICVLALLAALFILPRTLQAKQSDMADRAGETESGEAGLKAADTEANGEMVFSPVNDGNAGGGSKNETAKTQVEKTDGTSAAEQTAPLADENAVVVATVPVQKVVPLASAAKRADIRHTVQWGDTLWDISQSYYKTPWRYKQIAQYNHIKDPDYILSGTTVLIPAQ